MSKPTTTYTPIVKPATTMSQLTKPDTSFSRSAADDAAQKWTLNSTIVTLNSIVAYLNGYFTPTVPNQFSNKPATTMTPV